LNVSKEEKLRIFISIILALTLSSTAVAKRLTYKALITSARIYLKQMPKDYKRAQEMFQKAIVDFPDEPPIEAHVGLGEIHAEKNRYVEMVEQFRIADSICTDATDKKVTKRCKKERIHERTANVRKSVWIDEFNTGAENLSEGKDLREELEGIEDEEEKAEALEEVEAVYRSAADNFVNATTISPDSVQGWINLGITHYHLSAVYGEIGLDDADHIRALKDSSITAYRQALDVHPDNFDLLSNLATIYYELEDWEKCAETFGSMAALQADNVMVLQNLALLLLQLQSGDSARVVIDKVIELDPENQDMRSRRGFMEIERGSAISDSIKALKEADKSANKAEIDKLTEERDDAYRLVVEDFSVVTSLNPDDYEAWYFLGLCNFILENYENARDAWEKATEAGPDKAEPWESLAPLYLRLGDSEKSKEAKKKGEELRGN
jgi:tetratricopeptide (TPR) repeat protein